MRLKFGVMTIRRNAQFVKLRRLLAYKHLARKKSFNLQVKILSKCLVVRQIIANFASIKEAQNCRLVANYLIDSVMGGVCECVNTPSFIA